MFIEKALADTDITVEFASTYTACQSGISEQFNQTIVTRRQLRGPKRTIISTERPSSENSTRYRRRYRPFSQARAAPLTIDDHDPALCGDISSDDGDHSVPIPLDDGTTLSPTN